MFSERNIMGSSFNGADWSGEAFDSCYISDSSCIAVNARKVKFLQVEFFRCNMHGAVFGEAEISDTAFTLCNLMNADFTDAKLWNVRLDGSDIRGAIGLPRVQPVENLDSKLLSYMARQGDYLIDGTAIGKNSHELHLDTLTALYATSDDLRSSVGIPTAAALVYFASTGVIPYFSAPAHELRAGMQERVSRK